MSLAADVLIAIVNYSQDAAAAFLTVSIAIMRMLPEKTPPVEAAGSDGAFVFFSRAVMRIAGYSLCWIFAAGIPEMILSVGSGSSRSGEFLAAGSAARYAGMVLLALIGVLPWIRLSKKVSRMQSGNAVSGWK